MQTLLHDLLHMGAIIHMDLTEINKKYEDKKIKRIADKIEKMGIRISRAMINNIKVGDE